MEAATAEDKELEQREADEGHDSDMETATAVDN